MIKRIIEPGNDPQPYRAAFPAGGIRVARRVGSAVVGSALCLASLLLLASVFQTARAGDIEDPNDRRSRGDHRAPVVLIEYSDFTCGYCKKFFRETWPLIKANYVDTGKVRFLYRDYPRADQGPGVQAAVAARCAGDQGQYWGMHDRLLQTRRGFSEALFSDHARSLGLNLPAFGTCLRGGRHLEDIFRDRAQGAGFGFRGTPGFILLRTEAGQITLRGQQPIGLPGAFPYDVFAQQIEGLLAQSPVPQRG